MGYNKLKLHTMEEEAMERRHNESVGEYYHQYKHENYLTEDLMSLYRQ
jgi:hypothetical protein